ncbi:WD40 repeat domain-containing protein [Streptomyces massasporeus]
MPKTFTRRLKERAGAMLRACQAWLPPGTPWARRSIRVPVVVGDDAALLTLVLRYRRGPRPTLSLRSLRARPAAAGRAPILEALPPEPRSDADFDEAAATALAWARGQRRFPKRGRITWQLRDADGEPVDAIRGGSAGAAFAMALAYLFGLTRSARRRPRDPRAVISASVDAYGLLGPVAHVAQKAGTLSGSGHRMLVAPAVAGQAVSGQRAGRPEVMRVASVPEAVRVSALRRRLAVPISLTVLVVASVTGAWSWDHSQDQAAARLAADVEKQAALTQQHLGSAPDLAAAAALRAHLLDPASATAAASMLASAADLRLRGVIDAGPRIGAMAHSPDGRRLAVAAGRVVTVHITDGRRVLATTESQNSTVTHVGFTPDGDHVVLATEQGRIMLGELPDHGGTLPVRPLYETGARVKALVLGARGRIAWATDAGVETGSWSGPGRVPVRVRPADARVTALALLPGGRLAVGRLAGSGEPVLQVYPAGRDGAGPITLVTSMKTRSAMLRDGVPGMTVAEDGRTLITGSIASGVTLWDALTLRKKKDIDVPGVVYAVAATADGRTAVVATRDFPPSLGTEVDLLSASTRVRAIDLADDGRSLGLPYAEDTGAMSAVLSVHPRSGAPAVAIAPVDDRGRVALYAAPLRAGRDGQVTAVVRDPLAPDSVLVLYMNGRLIRYRPDDDRRTVLLAGGAEEKKRGMSLAVEPDGRTLAVGDGDGGITLYSRSGARKVGALPPRLKSDVFRMLFSPDGRTLAAGTRTGEVLLWNRLTRTATRGTLRGQGPVGTLAWQPDGERLLVGHRLGRTEILDSANGRPVVRKSFATVGTDDGQGDLSVAQYNRNGYLAGFGDGRIAYYDDRLALTAQLPHSHNGNVLNSDVSPDDTTLLTVSADYTALLLRLPEGTPLLRVTSPEDPDDEQLFYEGAWTDGAFTGDGQWAVLGGSRGHLNALALDGAALVQRVCALTDPRTRPSTATEACR